MQIEDIDQRKTAAYTTVEQMQSRTYDYRTLKADRPGLIMLLVRAIQAGEIPDTALAGIVHPAVLEAMLQVDWPEALNQFGGAPAPIGGADSVTSEPRGGRNELMRSSDSLLDTFAVSELPWHFFADYAHVKLGDSPSYAPQIHCSPAKVDLGTTFPRISTYPLTQTIDVTVPFTGNVSVELADDDGGRFAILVGTWKNLAGEAVLFADKPVSPNTFRFSADGPRHVQISFTPTEKDGSGVHRTSIVFKSGETPDRTVKVEATVAEAKLSVTLDTKSKLFAVQGGAASIGLHYASSGPLSALSLRLAKIDGKAWSDTDPIRMTVEPPFVPLIDDGMSHAAVLRFHIADECVPSWSYACEIEYWAGTSFRGTLNVNLEVAAVHFEFTFAPFQSGDVLCTDLKIQVSGDGKARWHAHLHDRGTYFGDDFSLLWNFIYGGEGDGISGSIGIYASDDWDVGQKWAFVDKPDWIRHNWRAIRAGGAQAHLSNSWNLFGALGASIKKLFSNSSVRFEGGAEVSGEWDYDEHGFEFGR